jgi:hypothetical protein
MSEQLQEYAELIGHNHPPPRDLREILAEDNAQIRHAVEKLAAEANVAPKEILTPSDLDVVGRLVKDARALWTATDKAREKDKAPFLQAERDIQTYYVVFLDRLKRIADTFQKIGDDYQKEVARKARVAAEAAAAVARAEQDRQRELAEKAAAASRPTTTLKHEARAEAAGEVAQAAEKVATAKAADLARVVTNSGLVASARTVWKGTITDWENIDLVALKPYLKREAVETAINQAVRMGVREIKVVTIAQDTKAAFR